MLSFLGIISLLPNADKRKVQMNLWYGFVLFLDKFHVSELFLCLGSCYQSVSGSGKVHCETE